MTMSNDAYYAGVIDGRGRVALKRRSTGTRGEASAVVEVHSDDAGLVDAVHKHFGVGKVDYYTPKHAPYKRVYVWAVRGDAGRDILERVAPHMAGRTGEAARDVLRDTTNGRVVTMLLRCKTCQELMIPPGTIGAT